MYYGSYQDKEYFKELAAKAGMDKVHWVKKAINSTPYLQDPRRREKLQRFLSIKIQQIVKEEHAYLPAPGEDVISQGDYSLCRVVTGRGPEYPAKVKKDAAPEHGIVVGPSGAGKTTWLVNLGQSIHRQALNPDTDERDEVVWFFDIEGQIPYFVAAAGALGCQDILLIDVPRMFKFNRYFPPTVPDRLRYITKVTAQDRESRYFRDFTMHMVRDACYELLNRQGVFNERQLLEHISSKKFKPGTRNSQSQESINNRFRDTLQFLGPLYDTCRSHNLAALTKRSVVWMLGGLSSDHKSLFIGDILLWLKECLPVSYSPKFKLVLIIDEFADFCNIERLKRADLQEPFLVDAARVFRKRGVSLMLGTQSVYTVPHVILSNISCFWLAFRPSEGYSMRILSQNLALTAEQAEYMMQMSDRQVVCRTKACPQPFLGDVGQITLPLATDVEINQRLEQSQRVLDSLLEPEPEPDQPLLFAQEPTAEQQKALFTHYNLTKADLDYLEFLAQHPFLPIGELDRIDSLSEYKANLIRQRLMDTGPGLIRIHRISTGKKGGPVSTVELPAHTLQLLDRLQIKYPQPVGHGSPEHKFWQHAIHRWAIQQGHVPKIECWLNGKSVDVGIEWDEKKVAIEIALEDMGKEISNLIKDMEAGWDQVVFCVLTDKELNRLRNEIAKRFGTKLLESGKVSFMNLSTFLRTDKHDKRTQSQSEGQEKTADSPSEKHHGDTRVNG
jgi:hypothetical protein